MGWGVQVPSNFGRKEWFLFPMWLPKPKWIKKKRCMIFHSGIWQFPIWNQFWSPSHCLAENNNKTINHEAIKCPYLPLVEGLHHSCVQVPSSLEYHCWHHPQRGPIGDAAAGGAAGAATAAAGAAGATPTGAGAAPKTPGVIPRWASVPVSWFGLEV